MAPTRSYRAFLKAYPEKLKPQPTPLLRLPGELRNRIYEYALTNENGLYYTKKHFNAGPRNSKPSKLALHTKELHKPKLVMADPVWDNLDIYSCSEVSWINSDYYDELKRSYTEDFNQLKYVCRQLYSETAGLELKYNDLILSAKWNLLSKLTQSFAEFPVSGTVSLRKVILRGPLDPIKKLLKLDEFCKQQPHITVHYQIVQLQYTTFVEDLMAMGLALNLVLRGVDLSHLLPHLLPQSVSPLSLLMEYQNMVVRISGSLPLGEITPLRAGNLKFWPGENLQTDHCKFEITDYATWYSIDDAMLGLWINSAMDWIRNGI